MILRLLSVLLLLSFSGLGYSQSLTFDWVQRQTGKAAVTTTSIVCDSAGNIYIGGAFSGMVNLGGITLTSIGQSDAYVARFSSNGSLIWAKQIGALHTGQTTSIALSPTGDLYAIGYVYDTSLFQLPPLVNRAFIARFTATGKLKWLLRSQNAGSATPNGIAVNHTGSSVYIAGTEADSMSLGTVGVGGWPAFSTPVNSIFISRIDSSGRVRWIRSTHSGSRSGNYNAGLCATVDDSENVFVGGSFADSLNLGGLHLTGLYTPTAVLLSLDSSGQARWVKNFAVLGTSVQALCASFGSLYAAGQSALAMRFRSSSAVDKIVTNVGTPLGAQAITSDGAGGIFLAGNFSGSLALDSVKIGNLSAKLFILKLDTGLHARWAAYTMVNHVTYPAIAANAAGQRFVSATYTDSIRIGPYLIGTTYGYTSGFVTLLSELDIACPFKPATAYCPGDSIVVPVDVIGHFGSDNVFYAKLSDSLSQFRGPKQIGMLAGTSNGFIRAVIPKSTLPGSHYRVRVTSTVPPYAGDDNGVNVMISAAPKAIMTPNGAIDLCEDDSLTLTASGGAHYQWSTGDTTPAIRVGASGDYSVFVAGSSGCGVSLPPATVVMRLKPPIPPVTRSGNTIYANVTGVQYQWYYNHKPLSGAVNSSLDITYNGTYNVTVTNPYHCTSTSEDYSVTDLLPSAVSQNSILPIVITAVNGDNIKILNAADESTFSEIDDVSGRPLLSHADRIADNEATISLPQFEALPSGIYYVRVEIAGQVKTLKLIHSH